MTDHKTRLLARLDAIGASLAQSGHGLALLGLGSVGLERERMDAYSDLDFFAIVEAGHKNTFVHDLTWLSRIQPIAFSFQNTRDGYKLLYEDGIFCEFAIFEPDELIGIPFTEGTIVWSADGFDTRILMPNMPLPVPDTASVEWLLGEALTNLYVGMGRYHRGEKLSAQQFVQSYAVNMVLKLVAHESQPIESPQPALIDPFNIERRFEQRFPLTAQKLGEMIQGYERTPQSARAILAFLDAHFEVNQAIKTEILGLCDRSPEGDSERSA